MGRGLSLHPQDVSVEEADLTQTIFLYPTTIVYVDGTSVRRDDFENDGEIWWMLTASTARLAEPGRLVVGSIEDAVRHEVSDPNSSCYQAKRESVRELSQKEGFELLDIPGGAIGDIQDVVSSGFRLDLKVRPTPAVMLRWRGHLYGPCTLSQPTGSQGGFSFAPSNVELTVFKIDEAVFDEATARYRVHVDETVSLSNNRRSETYQPFRATHDLVLVCGYEQALLKNPPKVALEAIDRKLLRCAKLFLTRAKRQELRHLLDELEVTGREAPEAPELVDAIGRIRHVTEKQDEALDAVATALMQSGLLFVSDDLGYSRFTRNEQNRVSGLLLTGGRIRRLHFVKEPS